MVDEFQDTNPLQMELLERARARNACTVGDELQSIYGFRHADVEVFRARRARARGGGRDATLATNFRARPEILAALDAAFAPLHERWVDAARPAATTPPAPSRRSSCWSPTPTPGTGTRPPRWAGLPAASAGQAGRGAARGPARRRAGARRGLGAGDIVVLLRAATDMGLYERALEEAGLATLAAGGRGWWARQQVQDLCA